MEGDIKREILDEFEASGGDVNVWALTTGLTWSPRLDDGFGFYVNAGIGGYRVEGQLKEPGVVCGPICPPWSWWCYPGCVPGTVITDSTSTTKFGYNLGVGFGFEVGQGSMIYLEAKYHRIETDVATEMIPIVVGYRW
jgi:opacity protein-like surface antigen